MRSRYVECRDLSAMELAKAEVPAGDILGSERGHGWTAVNSTWLFAYIFGSAYGSDTKVHNLDVLVVDYDGAVIGQSLHAADEQLKGPQTLGLQWHPKSQYPNSTSIYEAVYSGQFWAGMYTFEDASDRLAAALQDNDSAETYDPSHALGAVYNQARYPDFADADVFANLQTLVVALRIAYNKINGTTAVAAIAAKNIASLMVALNLIDLTLENIKPLENGPRIFYNTVGQVFLILLQFFFLMAFNTLLSDWLLDSRLPIKHHIIMRILVSAVYTFIGSLLVAANIYAFRGSVYFSAAQFVLLWMAFWLEMHVLFLILEIATTFLVVPFLPLFIITFIILNVTSTILPFELSPGFYRWGYALPCHELYLLEILIMSGGADNTLKFSLPILFAW